MMMPQNDASQSQIEGLATLLILDEEIRKLTTVREFGFFSTNETHRLIPYHTAYLWQLKEFIGTHLISQSGTAEIDIHAPASQWLIHKINQIRASALGKEVHQVNAEESESDWPEVLPNYLLWCPLLSKSKELTGGLIFFRESAFSEAEVKMLHWLISSYQYTWLILVKPKKIPSWKILKKKPYFIAFSLIILCVLLFPMRLSVLGEGTVVPKKPVLINAPMQGVIKSFAVSSGDQVKEGQLLVTMDKTDLESAVEVSKKDYSLTEAKLRTAINEGFDKKASSAEIPILRAQLAVDRAHLDYANEMLNKANITSPIDGVVVFESTEDWIGQPVKTGEKILLVADPSLVQLKIMLPITDSMEIKLGASGEFFLYGNLNSLTVKIITLGYNAKLQPNKVLAYQLRADFLSKEEVPQLGSQGTVKIYGSYVPFVYYVLRRPIQAMRQMAGI